MVHVHGFAGIGKTMLLRRFAIEAGRRHATVIDLDCRDIEPTERGFLTALSDALSLPGLSLDEVPVSLSEAAAPVVLMLDDYQHLFLLDTWVRKRLLPVLPENARVIMASREPPLPDWRLAPEWRRSFQVIPLGPLSPDEVIEFAERAGMSAADALAANRLAMGHPLALELAVSAGAQGGADVQAPTIEATLQQLAELHVRELRDRGLREGLEAASVLRRITIPMLSTLLPGVDAPLLYDRMLLLPYVDTASDGLVLHAAVQKALAAALRAADPERYRHYREMAWRTLRARTRSAGVSEMWRYTADMLFLLDNPHIREAFFPSMLDPLSTDDARVSDWPAMQAIVARHEPPAARELLERWWQANPHLFKVMRGLTGQIKGFYIYTDPTLKVTPVEDPLFEAWQKHLRESPVRRDETVIFLRRWLDASQGELPSSVQGACWLNVKQSYMALRPYLRRCYITVSDLQTYGPTASALGFRIVEDAMTTLDGVPYHLAILDMGPGSVDGWLSGHIAREIGLDDSGLLDMRSRELVLDGTRIHLTPLEFETMRHLVSHRGEAVSRASLVEAVWGYDFTGESNVVEALIAGLRRKLKTRSGLIETVWGFGYRLRPDAA